MDLFIREAEIWSKLRHDNVLKLLGASSPSGQAPWFFVSPYARNGGLVEYLKRAEAGVGGCRRKSVGAPGESKIEVPPDCDLYRFMHEIAKGMEYLHANDVLHGDLKVCFVFSYCAVFGGLN